MKRKIKTYDFFQLFERFIRDSRKGRRLQANGKRITGGTVNNYISCLHVIKTFCADTNYEFELICAKKLNSREILSQKRTWKRFYILFTNWMYDKQDYYDNYAGFIIRIIKTFFGYLNKELYLFTGDFHKQFYIHPDNIAIYPLPPEELHYLITNKEFEQSLSRRMLQVKDFFVFGCTVALRFSDLVSLTPANLRMLNNRWYLSARSLKTAVDSMIKLPDFAIEIIERNRRKYRRTLLPKFNLTNGNSFIKKLLEKAGFTQPVLLNRTKRGVPITLKKRHGKTIRFCDLATTHSMRRTAITTMLCLGMPEQLVRKVSGHTPSSKEFYRYITWAQFYQDGASDEYFKKLADLNYIENE